MRFALSLAVLVSLFGCGPAGNPCKGYYDEAACKANEQCQWKKGSVERDREPRCKRK